MSKVANMLNMLQLLKDGQLHSIKDLAERLEVSERMVRQYKQELEQVGIYIKSVTGKYGGYQLERDNDFLQIIEAKKEEMYFEMKRAIKNRNKVEIEFESVNTGKTKRIIHPAELFCYVDMWYVAAFCELRSEIRLFKLKDIKQYKILEEKYVEKVQIKK